ncbi:MAG: hypothetical protein ACTIJJ_05675 [Galactobacter sp.]
MTNYEITHSGRGDGTSVFEVEPLAGEHVGLDGLRALRRYLTNAIEAELEHGPRCTCGDVDEEELDQ